MGNTEKQICDSSVRNFNKICGGILALRNGLIMALCEPSSLWNPRKHFVSNFDSICRTVDVIVEKNISVD